MGVWRQKVLTPNVDEVKIFWCCSLPSHLVKWKKKSYFGKHSHFTFTKYFHTCLKLLVCTVQFIFLSAVLMPHDLSDTTTIGLGTYKIIHCLQIIWLHVCRLWEKTILPRGSPHKHNAFHKHITWIPQHVQSK